MDWLHVPLVVGITAVGILAAKLLESWIETATLDKGLLGEWFSTFQTNDPTTVPWAVERVRIYRTWLGRLNLRTLQSIEGGYRWKSKNVRTFQKAYIYGSWKSLEKPLSNGTFTLLLHKGSGHEFLLGFFWGPTHGGTRNIGVWVLARDRNFLNDGKTQMRTIAPTVKEVLA